MNKESNALAQAVIASAETETFSISDEFQTGKYPLRSVKAVASKGMVLAHINTAWGTERADDIAKRITSHDMLVEALRNIEAWTRTPGECTIDVIRDCVNRTIAKIES